MISKALPSFWAAYRSLDKDGKRQAKKAYSFWSENPFHPSLHFKCIHCDEDVWSVRISRGYRALGILEGNVVTWFWVGNLKTTSGSSHKGMREPLVTQIC